MKIQIVVYNGFDELDAIAPLEVLKNAQTAGADLDVKLATVDDPVTITASHGLRITPDVQLSAEAVPDVLLVPGGGWNSRAPQSAWAEAQRGAVPAAIAHAHKNGATIAAVCTGGMLVAAAGLLNDRPAITHRSAVNDLRAAGANVIEARVVDDGDIVTAGGVTSGLDLALWLVERFCGAEIAHTVEHGLEYERRGVVWRREKG